VHQAVLAEGAPVIERLFEGIEDKAGRGRPQDPPATMRRAKASMTKATSTNPCQVAT
jgi:hypothetical protein